MLIKGVCAPVVDSCPRIDEAIGVEAVDCWATDGVTDGATDICPRVDASERRRTVCSDSSECDRDAGMPPIPVALLFFS